MSSDEEPIEWVLCPDSTFEFHFCNDSDFMIDEKALVPVRTLAKDLAPIGRGKVQIPIPGEKGSFIDLTDVMHTPEGPSIIIGPWFDKEQQRMPEHKRLYRERQSDGTWVIKRVGKDKSLLVCKEHHVVPL